MFIFMFAMGGYIAYVEKKNINNGGDGKKKEPAKEGEKKENNQGIEIQGDLNLQNPAP